jgi:hypothetical protein
MDGPSSFRWRLAATVDPEVVALALAILFAFAVLLTVGFGSPSGNAENGSPGPPSEPRSSRSISIIGMREVRVLTVWPWLIELDPT